MLPKSPESTTQISAAEKILHEIKRLKEENLFLKQKDSVAIIGMACRFPGADNIDQFWELLENEKSTICDLPANRDELQSYFHTTGTKIRGGFLNAIDQFDASFFNISALEADSMDPQHRLLLEVAYEAVEDAGIDVKTLNGTQTGVFVGITNGEYFYKNIRSEGEKEINSYSAIGGTLSAASCRLSYCLGLEGPSMIIDTACSSSLVAIDAACKNLQDNSCTMAIAGGVNLMISPGMFVSMSRLNALSPDGMCKTFDDSANGYVRGEGCGMLILKKLSNAIADGNNIYAVIKGAAVNQDGKSNGITAPNEKAQQKAMQLAIQKAGIMSSDVDYVEAHGTGTKLGDPIELNAINEVYNKNRSKDSKPLLVGSVKTNIGHLESAAGVAGLIKVVLALQHKKIPASLHFNTPSKFISWNEMNVKIPQRAIEWNTIHKKRYAGLSSFGFTGTNVHMIIEEGESYSEVNKEANIQLLTVSAKSKEALIDLVKLYEKYLHENRSISLADFCYTTNVGRAHYNERFCAIVGSIEDTINKLNLFIQGSIPSYKSTGSEAEKLLEETCANYLNGEIVNWEIFYASNKYKKIRIPNYPFQHQQYWFGNKGLDKESLNNKSDYKDHLYELEWVPQDFQINKVTNEPALKQSEHWLIFSNDRAESKRIGEYIANSGKQVTTVLLGETYSQLSESCYCINPVSASDFKQLSEAIIHPNNIPISKILYTWNLGKEFVTETEFTQWQLQKIHLGLLNILQTFQCEILAVNAKLWVVTRGVHAIGNDVELNGLLQSPLWGMGKTIFLEHTELWGGMIDLGSNGDENTQIEQLVTEVENGGVDDHVAFRNNKRYVARLRKRTREEEKDIEITKNDFYLITGGLGYLGLHAAQWLCDRGAKNIVITTRQGFPDPKNWHLVNDTDRNYKQVSTLLLLQKQGVNIIVSKVDITNINQLEILFKSINAKKYLKGIIHAAGKSEYKVLMDMQEIEFEEMIAPKIHGTWNLHRLTSDLKLDFFIMFSSGSSVWGSKGLAHYSAANYFMDTLSYYRNSKALPALSINMGVIQGRGLAQLSHQQALISSGFEELKIADIFSSLSFLLKTNCPQATLTKINWTDFKNIYELRRKRPLLEELKSESKYEQHNIKVNRKFILELEQLPVDERKAYITTFLQNEIATILGLDNAGLVETNKGFFHIGLDSLMAVELKNRMEKNFKNISSTLIFDYPTIDDVVNYLMNDVIPLDFGLEKPIADVENEQAVKDIDMMTENELADLLAEELAK